MNEVLHMATQAMIAAGAAAMVALICRMDPLRWSTHRASVVLMHQCLAIACIWAMHEAGQGRPTIGGAAVIVGTISWLWVSYATWAGGPPEWTARDDGRRLGLRWALAALASMRRRP